LRNAAESKSQGSQAVEETLETLLDKIEDAQAKLNTLMVEAEKLTQTLRHWQEQVFQFYSVWRQLRQEVKEGGD